MSVGRRLRTACARVGRGYRASHSRRNAIADAVAAVVHSQIFEPLESRQLLSSVSEVESNDFIASATPLPLTEDPAGSGFRTSAVAVGSVDPAADGDYWSFAPRAGDRMSFDLERTSGGDGQRFLVYNAAGQVILDTQAQG